MSDLPRGVDRPGGLARRPQPGAITAREPGEVAALIDRVADFWRTASKSAGVNFIEQSPGRACVVDGNVVGVITDDPTLETQYDGRVCINNSNSSHLRGDISRRKRDFDEFLSLGRTLVVFLPGDCIVWAATGEVQYSGTGRNRAKTDIVKMYDICSVLPFELNRHPVFGKDMDSVDSSIGPLYRRTRESWSYQCTISPGEVDAVRPLLKVTGTDKLVGAAVTVGDGTAILLPEVMAGSDLSDDDDPETTPPGDPGVGTQLVDWLLAYMRSEEEEASFPDWMEGYRFASEIERTGVRERHESVRDAAIAELEKLDADQRDDDRWKNLVVGTGTAFENAVSDALSELGFTMHSTGPGRTDLRGSFDDQLVVVECKGVSKSASEKNCAQLEKWVAEELAEGRTAKGILAVNAWRETELSHRTEHAFPPQMRPYAESRQHCLVTGVQLLALVRAARSGAYTAGELARLLLSTSGVVDGWDSPNDAFDEIPASI